jgi:hypothetical protein
VSITAVLLGHLVGLAALAERAAGRIDGDRKPLILGGIRERRGRQARVRAHVVVDCACSVTNQAVESRTRGQHQAIEVVLERRAHLARVGQRPRRIHRGVVMPLEVGANVR